MIGHMSVYELVNSSLVVDASCVDINVTSTKLMIMSCFSTTLLNYSWLCTALSTLSIHFLW